MYLLRRYTDADEAGTVYTLGTESFLFSIWLLQSWWIDKLGQILTWQQVYTNKVVAFITC